MLVLCVQSVWQHPGGSGEGCRERQESAAAASPAAQLHPGRVLPAIYQRGAGEQNPIESNKALFTLGRSLSAVKCYKT